MPVDGVLLQRGEPGLMAVLAVLVGSTAFDGLTRTRFWLQQVPLDDVLLGTAGLAAMIAAVAGLYLVAVAAGRAWAGAPSDARSGLASSLAVSLIPIAVGYSVAHYASLLLFEGQLTPILLSDPFGTGADLLGRRDAVVDYTVASPTTVAYVQIGAIVLGHVLAVVIAHYRAVDAVGPRAATRSEYPLTALMLVLTGLAVTFVMGT